MGEAGPAVGSGSVPAVEEGRAVTLGPADTVGEAGPVVGLASADTAGEAGLVAVPGLVAGDAVGGSGGSAAPVAVAIRTRTATRVVLVLVVPVLGERRTPPSSASSRNR
ncbi:hypothetical protein [Actinocorallia libanotica]|uniref:hypothetical protein n=1 Tax=Actinocorallia libanotica TaxID=46162 RepID=UPI0031CE376E